MTCDCNNRLSTSRILFATLSSPAQCPACGRCVYVKTPVSEPLVVMLGVILIVVSIFFAVKKEWLYLFLSSGIVCVSLLVARFAEVKLMGIKSENKEEFRKSKSLDLSARLIWGALFTILMVIAYFLF